ncbi:MAG TPA: WG repeat-containing protein [Bacteroidia bacterium]|nr:WG repeat-containing protein [Bacteroidia bacterium]
MQRKLILFFFLIVPALGYAGKLEKGFEALRVYNYFRAQELFIQCEDRHPAGAHYGLALIYSRTDNPFHNIQRAHHQVLSSRWAYATSSVKEKIRLQKLGVNDSLIVLLEHRIDTVAYQETKQKSSVAAWNMFIDEYCGSTMIAPAIILRNELAFAEAGNANTWEAYKSFYETYPDAAQVPEAHAAYERRLYETVTADSSLNAYVRFVNEFPVSPYTATAEDMIYKLSVTGFSIGEYHQFIKTYPANRNVPDAWKSLYALYTADGSSTTIAQFWLTYPEFPFRETISEDLRLSMTVFYPIRENGKWGFADSTGKILIACQYEWADVFSEGVAAVGLNDKCGYINKNGSVAIPFQYDEGEPFSRGIAQVTLNGKTGLSNKAGDFIVPAVYDEIGSFHEARAQVSKKGSHGFIDMMGSEVVPCRYEAVGDFSEGLAYVKDTSGYGFVDREGRVSIQPQYDWVEPFENGSARVKKNELYGLISYEGKMLLPCEYTYIAGFSEGLALVVKDGMSGYVKRNGTWAIPVSNEYNRSKLGDNPFVNGRTRVMLKDKFGMIDTTGKIVVPREYDELGLFRDGLFPAKKKDKWGFIDAAMKLRVPYTYEYAWPYSEGVTRVKKDGLIGYIDSKGKEIVPPQFEEATDCVHGYMKVKTEEGWGLLDAKGNSLVPCRYDHIEFISSYELRLERDEKFGYYHLIRCDFVWKEEGLE